jgi:hypothetical protein
MSEAAGLVHAQVLERKPVFTPDRHAMRFATPALTRTNLDSKLPQGPILKEKPLIAGVPDLQMLAGESPDIVAFSYSGTTYRTASRNLFIP